MDTARGSKIEGVDHPCPDIESARRRLAPLLYRRVHHDREAILQSLQEIYDQWRDYSDASFVLLCCEAMMEGVEVLDSLARRRAAVACCDELLSRYGQRRDEPVRRALLEVWFKKAELYGALNDPDQVIATYARCQAWMREIGLDTSGVAFRRNIWENCPHCLQKELLDYLEGASRQIRRCDEILEGWGEDEDEESVRRASRALLNKATALRLLERYEDALDVVELLIKRYEGAREKDVVELVTQGRGFRKSLRAKLSLPPEE